MGHHIGADLKELGQLIKAVDPALRWRLKVCLDTQHCFAAGYDISTKGGLEAMLAEFDEAIDLLPQLPMHALLGNVIPLEHYAEVWTNFRQRKSLKVLLQVHKDVDLG